MPECTLKIVLKVLYKPYKVPYNNRLVGYPGKY